MSTTIRPEVSVNNPYWVERHRYYELKHFCLQYSIWQKKLKDMDGYSGGGVRQVSGDILEADPTYDAVEARNRYVKWIGLIEQTAKDTDTVLAHYILRGVTEGLSYDVLNLKEQVPCCRDIYYDMYRRFFWLLDRVRV